MNNTIKQVDLNNPADWNRFAPDELIKTSQLAEYFGVAFHIIVNNRAVMPNANIKGKPVLYLGSEITRWLHIPENRDVLRKYQKTLSVEVSTNNELVDMASSPKPKMQIEYSDETITITVSRSEFRSSGMLHFIHQYA